jgi:excinuclease ABC subunit B
MAILYADRMTGSMQRAIEETDRRRTMQREFNAANGIVPKGVMKSVDEVRFITRVADARDEREGAAPAPKKLPTESHARSREELETLVGELEVAMREAATALDFEAAARLRDQLFEVRTALGQAPAQARGNAAAPKRPPGSAPMRRGGGRRGR